MIFLLIRCRNTIHSLVAAAPVVFPSSFFFSYLFLFTADATRARSCNDRMCFVNYHTNFVFTFIAEIVAPLRQTIVGYLRSLSLSCSFSLCLSSDKFCCAHKISTEKQRNRQLNSYAIYRRIAAVDCRCIYICAQSKISEF